MTLLISLDLTYRKGCWLFFPQSSILLIKLGYEFDL